MVMRARTAQCCVVPPVGGLQAWPIDSARTRTRANVNVRPRPFAQRTGKEKEGEKMKERERERKESEVFSKITEVAAL